jgi:hypothetical protein
MTATAGNRSETVFLQELAEKDHSSSQAFDDIVSLEVAALMFRPFHDCQHCSGIGELTMRQGIGQLAAWITH